MKRAVAIALAACAVAIGACIPPAGLAPVPDWQPLTATQRHALASIDGDVPASWQGCVIRSDHRMVRCPASHYTLTLHAPLGQPSP